MIKEAIAYLNACGQLDPDGLRGLLEQRVLINGELAADPRLEANQAPGASMAQGSGMVTMRSQGPRFKTTGLALIAATLSAATGAEAPIVLRMRENNGRPEVYQDPPPEL